MQRRKLIVYLATQAGLQENKHNYHQIAQTSFPIACFPKMLVHPKLLSSLGTRCLLPAFSRHGASKLATSATARNQQAWCRPMTIRKFNTSTIPTQYAVSTPQVSIKHVAFIGTALVGGGSWVAHCYERGNVDARTLVTQPQKAAKQADKTVEQVKEVGQTNGAKRGSHVGMILNYMSKDKLLFAVAALASLLASLTTSAQARVIGSLFDMIGEKMDWDAFLKPVQQLIALFVGQAVLSFAASVSLAIAATRLGTNIREDFFAAILRQDIEMFDDAKTGELSHQLSQDVAELQSSVRTIFTRGVESVTSIVSGSVLLYLTSPKLAVVMFGLLPVAAFAASGLGHVLRDLSLRTRRASNRTTGVASESIGSIRTVRAFAAEDRELERYSKSLGEVSKLKMSMAIAAGSFYSGLYLGINCITLLLCGYGGYLVGNGELTKGGIAAAVTQVQILERALAKLSVLSAQFSKAIRASAHIFEIIQCEPKVNTVNTGICLREASGDISFENVSFAYPSRPEKVVLRDFTLHAKPGNVVALVGHSGSGKSTCAALLERFYDVTEGRITLDGHDLRDLNPEWLHHVIGIVSQEPALFSGSVMDNIRFGRPSATDEEVIQAAKQANAFEFVEGFPNGFNTELGERGVLLSGGQRQRIAIARCLLRDPKVLILDEATSALDNQSEFLVQQALQKLMEGRTTIVIAHRLGTIRDADIICCMEQGRIVEQGSHDELLSLPDGVYKSLFKRQSNLRT